jgi:hypothetical protein
MATAMSSGWEMVFRLACLERRGEAYQDLFAEIMERREVGFQRVRPWGKQGDRKNDGWSPSRRTLFQCYAPSSLSASDLTIKLREDYDGAIDYWEQYFDVWIFVHDDLRGMAPVVAKCIVELDAKSKDVSCGAWGYPELREEFALLQDADRAAILGPELTGKDFRSVSAAALRPLIDALGHLAPDPAADVKPVPSDKIEANALLPAQVEFLTLGSGRAPLVEHYLTNAYVLPTHADAIAEAVTTQYRALRDDGKSASEIFDLLLAWICGGEGDSTTRANALAILAYFFDRCHIFEISGVVVT